MIGVLSIAAIVGVGIGVGFILVALRGRRIDDHPVCRACRFDLIGLNLTPGEGAGEEMVCPECGGALRGPGAIRIGRRRRRPRLGAVGVAMIVLGGGFLVLIGPWGAAGGWIQQRKPTWWLIIESGTGIESAANELARRGSAGRLSQSDRRQLAEIVVTRAERGLPFSPAWNALYAEASLPGDMSRDQQARWVNAIIRIDFGVRPRVRSGDDIPFRIWNMSRYQSQMPALSSYTFALRSVSIDGRTIGGHGMFSSSGALIGLHRGSYGSTIRAKEPLPLGTHEAGVTCEVSLNGVSLTIERRCSFEVVAEDAVLVLAQSGSEVRNELGGSVVVRAARVAPAPQRRGESHISMMVSTDGLGMPICCDVYWVVGGEERQVGTLVAEPGAVGRSHVGVSFDPELAPGFPPLGLERVDVVLRPSVRLAETRCVHEEIYGETMVFEGIPVIRVERPELNAIIVREQTYAVSRFE